MGDAFLDDVFDEACDRLGDGRPIDTGPWVRERPELRDAIEETVRLARAVAVRPGAAPGLDDYELLEELGRGAMGTVWLARQLGLGGRLVALKVLAAEAAMSETRRARFLQESLSLARLRHPNIVAVHDVVDRDDVLAYAMEWIDGKTFGRLIDERRETVSAPASSDGTSRSRDVGWVPFVCRVGVQIARALAEVHRAGLVHRDVKPSNILVRDDATALLSDFGLVHDPEQSMHTMEGAFLGTIAYAAPEQLRGADADARSDIYGLGATLFEALALERAFSGSSPGELARAIENGRFAGPRLRRRNRALPRDLETVVHKAMEHESRSRYDSADELADDLERVLGLRPVRARRATVSSRVSKFVRRNSRVLGAGLVGAVAMVGLFVGLSTVQNARNATRQRVVRLKRRARVAMLDSGLRARIRVAVGVGEVSRPDIVEVVDRAIGLYDRVLDLAPSDDESVAERATLVAARRRLRSESAAAPVEAPEELEDLPSSELRSIGMAAYLDGKLDLAVRALEAFESRSRDVFVDGLLGQVHLARGRPELAYPRLLRVSDALPSAGHIHVAAASAAVETGDAAIAERILARAVAAEEAAPPLEIRRVRADILWSRGRADEALSIYGGLTTLAGGFERLTQFREASGDHALALRGYVSLSQTRPNDREIAQAVLRTGCAWWGELTRSERQRLLAEGLEGKAAPVGLLYGVLAVVARIAKDGPGGRRHRALPIFVSARPSEAVPLGEFVDLARFLDDIAVDIGRCVELPKVVRAQLVESLLDRERGRAQHLVREHRLSLGGRRAFAQDAPAPNTSFRVVAALPDPELAISLVWGTPIAAVGDLDSDGIGDLALHTGGAARRGLVRAFSGRSGEELWHASGGPFDVLGFSLAGCQDIDGDGVREVIARAAPIDGRVSYVSVHSSRDGRELHRILGRVPTDTFGHALAFLGDTDRDGEVELVAGAPGVGADGRQSGAALVVSVTGSVVREVAGFGPRDSLGESVAVVGDVDGDGVADFAAGTERRESQPGYAILVSGRDGRLLRRFGGPKLRIGPSVRVAGPGDLDGDGIPDLLIAWQARLGAEEPYGHCVAFSGKTYEELFRLRGARAMDGFGNDVVGVGDVDGDGRPDVAVAACSEASLRPPSVQLFDASGNLLAEARGWWRLRRLGTATPPRFAALSLGAWTRYADIPMGRGAKAAILELVR